MLEYLNLCPTEERNSLIWNTLRVSCPIVQSHFTCRNEWLDTKFERKVIDLTKNRDDKWCAQDNTNHPDLEWEMCLKPFGPLWNWLVSVYEHPVPLCWVAEGWAQGASCWGRLELRSWKVYCLMLPLELDSLQASWSHFESNPCCTLSPCSREMGSGLQRGSFIST